MIGYGMNYYNEETGRDRVITPAQEEAYRLCHHDHYGLTTLGASWCLGITKTEVEVLLASMEAVAPQLFPIIEPDEWDLWCAWLAGVSMGALATAYGCSDRTIRRHIEQLKLSLGYPDLG